MDALQEAGYAAEKATKSQSPYAEVLRQEAIMWALLSIAEAAHAKRVDADNAYLQMQAKIEGIAANLKADEEQGVIPCNCKGWDHECPICHGIGWTLDA